MSKTREVPLVYKSYNLCIKGCAPHAFYGFIGNIMSFPHTVCSVCGGKTVKEIGRFIRLEKKFLWWWNNAGLRFERLGGSIPEGWCLDPGLDNDSTAFLYPAHWNKILNGWPSLHGLQADTHDQYFLDEDLQDPKPPEEE